MSTAAAPKTVFITGSSAGFGRLAAEHFAAKGWNVVATMRTPEKETELTKLSNVTVARLDVQDQESIDAAVAVAVKTYGAIDVLINNAGFAAFGFVEGVAIEEVKRQFDVNFFGVVRVTKAVLPVMRKAKAGTVIITSSVIGGMSSPFGATYAASKWAVEGWAETLSYELLPFNIQVKLVQPGGYKTSIQETGMTMGLEVAGEGAEPYAAMAEGIKTMMAGVKWHDPNPVVAETFYKAATEGDAMKLRYPVYHEEDLYGKVYALRQEKGAEAQYAATVASLQPKKEE